jgi:hypothetical protein
MVGGCGCERGWAGVAVSMRHLTAKLTLIPTPTQENGPEERIAPAQLQLPVF